MKTECNQPRIFQWVSVEIHFKMFRGKKLYKKSRIIFLLSVSNGKHNTEKLGEAKRSNLQKRTTPCKNKAENLKLKLDKFNLSQDIKKKNTS